MTYSRLPWICFTSDIWSCKNRSFLGINGHYIDENTLERRSHVLSCNYFPAPHNFETITERFQLLYHQFDIRPSCVRATITDNGSNFLKAFRVYGLNNDEFKKFLENNDDGTIETVEAADFSKLLSVLNNIPNDEKSVSCDDYETEALLDLLYSTINEHSEEELYDSEKTIDLMNFFNSRISNIEMNEETVLALSNHCKCSAHCLNLIGSIDRLRAHRNKEYSRKYVNVFEKLNLLWHASSVQERNNNKIPRIKHK